MTPQMTLPENPSPTAVRPGAASATPAIRRERRDWWHAGGLLAVVAALHLVAFGILAALVAPHHYRVGTEVFGPGLGVTAYTLGMRHAFDADHIAAITRPRA